VSLFLPKRERKEGMERKGTEVFKKLGSDLLLFFDFFSFRKVHEHFIEDKRVLFLRSEFNFKFIIKMKNKIKDSQCNNATERNSIELGKTSKLIV